MNDVVNIGFSMPVITVPATQLTPGMHMKHTKSCRNNSTKTHHKTTSASKLLSKVAGSRGWNLGRGL